MALGDWSAKLVEQDGTVVRTLVNANVYSVTDELNGVGSARVGVPKHDPAGATGQVADLLVLDRELQVWRHNGTTNVIVWWGPIVLLDASSDSEEMTLEVPGLGWYFTRRQISDARANRLTNGDFVGNITGWTNTGASTDSYSTTRAVLGAGSLKLVQATAGVDTFDYQQQTFTAGSIGSYFTLAAWVWIDSATFAGPAYESRGLFISGIESGTVRDYRFVEIDDATPKNQWVRLETGIWIEPGATWTLETRLYAPAGEVFWDAVTLTKMESLSYIAQDLGTIVGGIASFIGGSSHGWSDLGWLTSNVTSGVTHSRAWQYADHIDGSSALNELVEMGIDWHFALTSTTKTFTSSYPKGTDRSATVSLSMRNGGSGNLSNYRLTVDGSQTTTRVTVLGEGDGPDREEGYAADASSLGGLVLGEVISAPPQSPISALSTIASKRLAKSKRLVRVLEVTGIPNDSTQHGTLVVGDTVDVSISDGWVAISGDWRIVRKTTDCVTDTVSFVLNEV